MSPRYRCLSCDGIYTDPGPNQLPYYHVCPEARLVPTGKRVRGRVLDDQGHEVDGEVLEAELRPVEQRRDENVVRPFRKEPPILRSEGKGRVEIP